MFMSWGCGRLIKKVIAKKAADSKELFVHVYFFCIAQKNVFSPVLIGDPQFGGGFQQLNCCLLNIAVSPLGESRMEEG